jgi:hypothetical protein
MIGKKRNTIIFTFFILFLVLTLNSRTTQAEIDYGVSSISIDPQPLVTGENMTISVNFHDITNLSLVKLLVCQLVPEFKCELAPIIMENETSYDYVGKFLVYYDKGTSVGFHIQIVYENGSSILIPDRENFLVINTSEPQTDEFFFYAGIVGVSTEETNGIMILTSILSLMVIAIWIKRRKNK